MDKGKIIFLNGVSSSGKTTLAKILQERLSEPFFWLSIDRFTEISPFRRHWESNVAWETYNKMFTAFHHTIKAFSDVGVNVIVDHVQVKEPNTMEECLKVLHEYPVLFVHVICPLEELRRREKERGDRGIGQAEGQLPNLCPQDNTYDITIDTFANSTEECADKIIEMLDYPEKFTAFKILWEEIKN